MNNLIYNIPKDWYNFKNITPDNFQSFNNTFLNQMPEYYSLHDLENPEKGFEKGNLFKNLYDPYKNYQYTPLNPKNDREKMLFNVLKYKFTLNELNLYLDNHPTNQEYIALYNKYLQEEKKQCLEYEKKYGPLTLDSPYLENSPWMWNKSPWPWEGTK